MLLIYFLTKFKWEKLIVQLRLLIKNRYLFHAKLSQMTINKGEIRNLVWEKPDSDCGLTLSQIFCRPVDCTRLLLNIYSIKRLWRINCYGGISVYWSNIHFYPCQDFERSNLDKKWQLYFISWIFWDLKAAFCLLAIEIQFNFTIREQISTLFEGLGQFNNLRKKILKIEKTFKV